MSSSAVLVTCDEPPRKKPKPHALSSPIISWILFPSPNATPKAFQILETVFWRSKSAKELGRRGTVVASDASTDRRLDNDTNRTHEQAQQPQQRVTVRFQKESRDDCTSSTRTDENHHHDKHVPIKRLLPVFVLTQQGVKQRGEVQSTVIVVTAETTSYRNMASSQLTKDDVVLEIGCSTGEASAIMVQYCKSWVGLDTSEEMVRRCNQRISQVEYKSSNTYCTAFQVDALADPNLAEQLVLQGLNGTSPNKIFIDIGGNRDCEGVWRMLAWAMSMMPILVVIKSREFFTQVKDEGVTTSTINGAEWMDSKLQQLNRHLKMMPSHPLQAPLRHVVEEKPICRYHNYHKDGCKRYRNESKPCPLDHDHCHWCLEKGHVARHCPLLVTATAEQAL